MTTKKRILITGSNRSGSTWVGKVVASNSTVDNIIEPLNLNRINRYKRVQLDHWYPRVNEETPEEVKKEIRSIMKYYLNATYWTAFTQLFSSYEGHNLSKSLRKRLRRAGRPVKMVKDPTALFCVPWLVNEYNIHPVVLIRHPAAYVLSIKQKNWWFDFDHILKQPGFFTGELADLKDEVVTFKRSEKQRDIVENAALMWKVFYTQVAHYRSIYPEWYYVTHEELSTDPLSGFEKMFSYLGLTFTEMTERFITDSTTASSNTAGKHKRDAKANARKWIDELNSKEKETIYKIAGPISDLFYENF